MRPNLKFIGQKQFKEEHIKRILTEMLDKYCLLRIKANRELKESLGITTTGYPFLILRSTEK